MLGALVHRHDTGVLGVDVPWGLLPAVPPPVPVALPAHRTASPGSAAVMIGWGLVLVLQGATGRGQYLIAGDRVGWTFTLLGLALLVAVVLQNSRLRR